MKACCLAFLVVAGNIECLLILFGCFVVFLLTEERVAQIEAAGVGFVVLLQSATIFNLSIDIVFLLIESVAMTHVARFLLSKGRETGQ